MRLRPLLLAALAALALPGCLESRATQPTPSEPARDGLVPLPPDAPEPAPAEPREPVASRMVLTFTGEVAAAGRNVAVVLQREGKVAPSAGASAYLVEMAWTPTSPLSQELALNVLDAAGTELARAAGPSPLRILLEAPVPDGVAAYFAPAQDPGAVPRQDVAIHTTAFHGTPVPDGYTALP